LCGSGDEFAGVGGVAMESEGNLYYVVDTGNNRIQVLSLLGGP
jgi:hypothetical protein